MKSVRLRGVPIFEEAFLNYPIHVVVLWVAGFVRGWHMSCQDSTSDSRILVVVAQLAVRVVDVMRLLYSEQWNLAPLCRKAGYRVREDELEG